ncbi:aspartyl/asparaginyl beta-hydroxylase domain-containing protein [Burkholderia vietnamiensis]|uniref:aspartyl/asparaginyl beta-hydroxylase domain-containing protein n=1 Tax=Burkholderia vietnamiensis TaxID=60552 RepID=UPI002653EDD6|nr:aspartyl/asparaginyl beta-hydroxylase domain-containing protein [Burkholderia vietnamiensis]MDN8066333.1 aspartyl/asparaginyl beta-hydroxylase domain-containing protein [Burkholderia vietnamiensis]
MRNFLKIDDGVDVAPLVVAIDAHPELWDSHKERKTSDGSPHTGMSDIWVRYNDIRKYRDRQSFNDEHVPVWYPAYHALPEMRPILFDLMATVQGEMLGGVLITRIPPGAGIAAHVDEGWHVEYYDKFYVSLRSAPGAEFYCDEGGVEVLNPKEGEIWRFDNRKNHWVENNSDRDRITLIVCIRTEKYREQS